MQFSFSLSGEKFRRTFLVFFVLSFFLPILIMIYIIFQYVFPLLSQDQIDVLKDSFIYGLMSMSCFPILGFFLMFHWTKSIETLTKDVKSKAIQIIEGEEELKDENEIMALQQVFNTLQADLIDSLMLFRAICLKLGKKNL
jgi:hypothetical protein